MMIPSYHIVYYHTKSCHISSINLVFISHRFISDHAIIIISEPINNLATNNGIIGYFARRSTKVGKGDEIFRYNYENLHHALKKSCEGKFVISEIKRTTKDLILLIKKK